MAEIDDLVMQIERLKSENRRLTSQLNLANREVNRCLRAIKRYQIMIDDDSEHFSRLAKDMKTYSDNIQEFYKQWK